MICLCLEVSFEEMGSYQLGAILRLTDSVMNF